MSSPIEFAWSLQFPARADLQVVLVQNGNLLPPPGLSSSLRRALAAWLKESKFESPAGATACPSGLERPILLLGIGSPKEFHPARWLRAWAAVGRMMVKTPAWHRIAFEWPETAEIPPEIPKLAELAAEGLLNGSYVFETYKSRKTEGRNTFLWCGESLCRPAARAAVRRAFQTGSILAEIRNLANLPANELGPMELAAEVRRLARRAGLSCRVLDMAELKREKCGAFLAVAQGSRRPGCLIRLAYKGARRGARLRPLVLVGKAVMFDSGGLSLKPGKNMEWMKFDKSGGMTVLAAVLLAANRRLTRPVVAYLAAADNMPDGNAARPGDIVTARNGKSIEIVNTDAEGRLLLADALSFAAEEEPAAIVDLATLTGAAIIALGHEAAAVMGNDDRLVLELSLSGEAMGERLWPLPLWPEYLEPLRSPFAELKNVGDGAAGTITGGIFLRQFVPEHIPWAHLDIAGTAWLEAEKPHGVPGATLAGARLLADWCEQSRLDT